MSNDFTEIGVRAYAEREIRKAGEERRSIEAAIAELGHLADTSNRVSPESPTYQRAHIKLQIMLFHRKKARTFIERDLETVAGRRSMLSERIKLLDELIDESEGLPAQDAFSVARTGYSDVMHRLDDYVKLLQWMWGCCYPREPFPDSVSPERG